MNIDIIIRILLPFGSFVLKPVLTHFEQYPVPPAISVVSEVTESVFLL